MRIGLLGTGAIAAKHAQAYRNIGFQLAACSNQNQAKGKLFAECWDAEFVSDWRALCEYPNLDYIDVCTFPDFHVPPVQTCARLGRAVLLQKPIATNLGEAKTIVDIAAHAEITIGVMSQHRFDDATLFVKRALDAGRLGRLLQADAYVKWFRSEDYYARPIKGSWQTEGGGALINQAIHQVDLLLYWAGGISGVQAMWQLGARNAIESEDVVNALLRFESGATGVLQAATAFWPGYPERIELHGTKGSAIITGDQLTTWNVSEDQGVNVHDPAPLRAFLASGASDPMAISLTSFERQFQDFATAVRERRQPSVDARQGYRALEVVTSIYQASRTGALVQLGSQST